MIGCWEKGSDNELIELIEQKARIKARKTLILTLESPESESKLTSTNR